MLQFTLQTQIRRKENPSIKINKETKQYIKKAKDVQTHRGPK